MKLRNILLVVLALCSVSVAYAAERGRDAWYFGLNATSFNFERTGSLSHSYNTYGMMGILGVDLGPYLALEVRGGQGDSDADYSGLTLSAREVTAGYLRLNLPLDDGKVVVYALGGAASVNIKAEASGVMNTKSLSGSSYGVGIELYGSKNTAFSLEYTRYLSGRPFKDTDPTLGLINEKFDVNALSFGIVHHF